MPEVVIIILNWNSCGDTIECLESVFCATYPDFKVILVDNGSKDDSVTKLIEWAGRRSVVFAVYTGDHVPVNEQLMEPVKHNFCERTSLAADNTNLVPLSIISIDKNLGFAGGNNNALRFIQHIASWKYVWLLNNDTVVTPEALTELVHRMEENPGAGMCGSLIPYYDRPDIIWAQGGGTFNRWFARSGCISNGLAVSKGLSRQQVESKMNYVAGASMLVARAFIKEIGLMCEDYFLYFEEPDWAFRGRHQFSLAYAHESIVYHKVGASTKKGFEPGTGINRPEDYIFRNSLLFTWKFSPCSLPFVFIRVSINRIRAWIGGKIRRSSGGQCV